MSWTRDIARALRPLVLLLASVFALSLGACASLSSKPSRVVVMPIEDGDAAGRVVGQLIDDRYERVPTKRYVEKARALAATGDRDSDIAKVSRSLKLDAVVSGRLEKSGKEFVLQVRIHDGKSGRELSSFSLAIAAEKLSSKERRVLSRKLYAAMGQIDGTASASRSKRGGSGESMSEIERERSKRIRRRIQAREIAAEERRRAKQKKRRFVRGEDRPQTEEARAKRIRKLESGELDDEEFADEDLDEELFDEEEPEPAKRSKKAPAKKPEPKKEPPKAKAPKKEPAADEGDDDDWEEEPIEDEADWDEEPIEDEADWDEEPIEDEELEDKPRKKGKARGKGK